MTIQLMIPDSMAPEKLRAALLALKPDLEIGTGHIPDDPDEVEYAVVWKHHHGSLRRLPNLKAICVYGHGVDDLLKDPDLPENVPIVRLKDETMALWMSEYLLTVVLMDRRQMIRHAIYPVGIQWGQTVRRGGNHVGLLGLGYLGQDAARVFLKMGFDVSGWSRSVKHVEGVHCLHGRTGLEKILSLSDYLICLLPLTRETENILNRDTFLRMKPGAYLINVGRGNQLVEEDLLSVIDEGRLSGACLDVFSTEPLPPDHPFRSHPKILVTPHNSSSTPAHSVASMILENFTRAVAGRKLLNLVDLQRGY